MTEEPVKPFQSQEEVEAYLAKIRRTVKQSETLIESVELRIAETDRFLAEHGLTRDDVKKLLDNAKITPEMRKKLDEELAKLDAELACETAERKARYQVEPAELVAEDDNVASRQQKFNMMMQDYRL